MTWTLNASGHHNTSDWVAEEYSLLRSFVAATEDDETTVTSNFKFNGNHVQADSLEDAKAKLAAYAAQED